MSTHAQATSIRTTVVVEAPIERAFRVFTEDFGSFKPPEHNMLAVEIAETVFEPRVGGHLYDRGVDGSECRWARVLAYEPPHRVVISWDIDPRPRWHNKVWTPALRFVKSFRLRARQLDPSKPFHVLFTEVAGNKHACGKTVVYILRGTSDRERTTRHPSCHEPDAQRSHLQVQDDERLSMLDEVWYK